MFVGCKVGAGTELKAISTLLKRQSDIVGATVTHRSLADIKAAMLSVIQSQMDWQKALDDMFEVCGVDTRMTVRGINLYCLHGFHVLKLNFVIFFRTEIILKF